MDVAVTTAETAVRPLTAGQLYRPSDLSGLTFSTTAELQPVDGLVGQARAVEAIRFGTRIWSTNRYRSRNFLPLPANNRCRERDSSP